MFYVNSFPRSGNTWIRLLLLDLLKARAPTVNRMYNREHPELNDPNALYPEVPDDLLKESEHRHILKSHGKWETCHREIPIIYLVRDARDAIYSYFHYNCDHENLNESWEEYFNRYVVAREYRTRREAYLDKWMGNWSENVRSYLGRDNVLLLHYENIRNDTFTSIRKILEYVSANHIPDELLRYAIGIYEKELDNKRNSHHRHRGGIQNWRTTYSPEQLAKATALFGRELTELGYEV